jgi:hypothetical protein
VAGDDAFALARNPAALARLRDDTFALGFQGAGWRFERDDLPGLRGTADNRVMGGPAFAWARALGRSPIQGWTDPFDTPIRAALGPAPQAREGRGELRIPLAGAPRAVEVRAKGHQVTLTNLLITSTGPKGGKPLGSHSAKGGTPRGAGWLRLTGWSKPAWGKGGGVLVVTYSYAFTKDAGEDAFAVVRVDVDGTETARREHEAPEPARGGGDGATGRVPDTGPIRVADILDAPSAEAVARLERGHWRLGIVAAPAAYFSSSVDAPGQPSGYRMQYAVEALTIGVANELFERFAVGLSGHLYASTIFDLQMPATFPNAAAGTQTDALDLDLAYTAGFGFSAGLTWQPCPRKCVTVGLHYTSRSWLGSHRGDAEATGLSIPLVAVNNVTASWDAAVRGLNLPQHAGLGIVWRPGTHDGTDGFFLLAADLTWWDWGEEANDIKIVLDGGDANAVAATGTGTTRVRVPLNWVDRWSAAIGASVRVWDPILLHCGYAYGRNPATNHNTHPLLPAVIRHHVAAGTTVKVGAFELSASVLGGLPEEVTLSGAGGGADLTVWELGGAFSVQYRF